MTASRDTQPSSNGSKAPSSRGGGSRGGARPVGEVDQPLAVRLHLVAERGQPAAGVAEGDPRPLGQVAGVGRPVTGEVAPRQPRQQLVAVGQLRRVAEPVPYGDEGVLPAAHRAAHHVPAQRRREQDVHHGLAAGGHTAGVEGGAQLGAGARPLGHGCGDDLRAALGLRGTDTFLLQASQVAGPQLGRGQRVQPPVVLGRHQVQRAAVEPADEEGPVGQCRVHVGCGQAGRAAADGEARTPGVLALHGKQTSYDVLGRPGRRPAEELGGQPRAVHPGRAQAGADGASGWSPPGGRTRQARSSRSPAAVSRTAATSAAPATSARSRRPPMSRLGRRNTK